jgi:SAM-dependent methyltransferase
MNKEIIAELDKFEGKLGLLSYHVPYLKQFCKEFDVTGKDILEVGGAMPPEIVIDLLSANSWTCTEDATYDELLGRTANQQTLRGGANFDRRYKAILENIENFGGEYDQKFDCIFSIACFEHIQKLPEALQRMWSLLKPGGKLFSMFSPIWSCHDGHHLYHLEVPDRFQKTDPTKILQPWEHLLKSRYQLHHDITARYDREFADEVVYNVFNNPHINRYFTEDYIHIFRNSMFQLDKFYLTFSVPVGELEQKQLERQQPGYKLFSNMGLYLFITK